MTNMEVFYLRGWPLFISYKPINKRSLLGSITEKLKQFLTKTNNPQIGYEEKEPKKFHINTQIKKNHGHIMDKLIIVKFNCEENARDR